MYPYCVNIMFVSYPQIHMQRSLFTNDSEREFDARYRIGPVLLSGHRPM